MFRLSLSQMLTSLSSVSFVTICLRTVIAGPFSPQLGGLKLSRYVDPLPLQYDLAGSQSPQINNLNSWWSTSFVTGSDDHQYLILSNVAVIPQPYGFGFYRASILDITDPLYFQQYTTLTNLSSVYAASGQPGFAIDTGDYGYKSVTTDPLGTLHTYSTNKNVTFNITIDLSAPVILDGGSGTFSWEQPVITNEWSMPAGHTTGTFTKNNTTITINPSNSQTWYDRQWGQGQALNFTWFQIHLNNGNHLSTWFFPSGTPANTTRGFATVGYAAGIQKVIPASYEVPVGARSWTSPHTGNTYVLDYIVELLSGEVYEISMVREDQEVWDSSALVVVYDGYFTVSRAVNGVKQQVGYGMIELMPVPRVELDD